MFRRADRRTKVGRSANGKRTDRVKKTERARMLRLRNQSKTLQEIALELGRNERTVSKQLEKAVKEKEQATTRDIIIKDALRKHFNALLDLLDRLETQVNEINDKRPIGIVRDAMQGTKEPSGLETGSFGGAKGYEGICKWEGKSGRIARFWLDVEEDRLFKYLRQHLEGEVVWRLYEEWKESVRHALEVFNALERKNMDGSKESILIVMTPIAECYDNLIEELIRVQHKQALPGKCDACPD